MDRMGAFRFWVLLILIMAAGFLSLVSFATIPSASSVSSTAVSDHDRALTVMAKARKMMENEDTHYPKFAGKTNSDGELNLEDYRPIDPAPASKASVEPGPIEHGSPLNPYIPRRPPLPPPPRRL